MSPLATRSLLSPMPLIPGEPVLGQRPYIGVSGVTTPYQADLVLGLAKQTGLAQVRDIVLGIKATHKTHMLDSANKYGADWYPVGDDIGTIPLTGYYIFPTWVRPVAQVFLDDPASASYRDEFTTRLARRCSPGLYGIQYDLLPWHEPALTVGLVDYLAGVRAANYHVYLQVHGPAMALGPAAAAEAFEPYAPYVDHLLFDSSHGTGTAMDTTRLAEFLDAFSGFGIAMGVAGGLGPDVPLADLLAAQPGLSWDAESRLHPQRPDGSRRLDLGLVEDYLRASATLITSAQSKDPR